VLHIVLYGRNMDLSLSFLEKLEGELNTTFGSSPTSLTHKPEFRPKYINFSTYLTRDTLSFRYRTQRKRSMFIVRTIQKTQIQSLGRIQNLVC
jgi:hypothetical protein